MKLDETKLQKFMEKAVGDLSAAASGPMLLIGDQLGLYKVMAENGRMTPADLAKAAGCHERYIREWMANQAATGYISYDATEQNYYLNAEQSLALADEQSPVFLGGGFQVLAAMYAAQPKIMENFKTGKGLDWGDHDPRLFEGTERFFRPNYIAHLVGSWIPALDGVEAKLKQGARVADIGCGLGTSTILMAKAFPESRFFGFDYHPKSIETARDRAEKAGVADRVQFEVATAANYPGSGYDFVTHFDCLHDMGDPVAAGRHVRETLAPDGTWMVVEPMAGDCLEDNLHPLGGLMYAASTHICVPASLAQDGIALGAQAGEPKLREIFGEAGFTHIRRASETPFNMVLEIKK